MDDAGMVRVTAAPARGMITLRAALDDPALAQALETGLGVKVPGQRAITRAGSAHVAWMSPDELLVMVPPADTARVLAALREALANSFATLADVSDARAMFTLSGRRADEVVMKLAPVDIARLGEAEIRRTRAAQAAVALWRSGDAEITVICFRSVATYVQALLENAAAPGAALAPR